MFSVDVLRGLQHSTSVTEEELSDMMKEFGAVSGKVSFEGFRNGGFLKHLGICLC